MKKRIIITNGLALFAMFFGAGNIIYPLELGAQAGDHILYIMFAFLISGIGLPFLGLFATSLYHGDYWAFFNRLGKIPAFALITFLVLFIGPLFATPRTETVAYNSLLPFLPTGLNNVYGFSALYCVVIFAFAYRHTKLIDLIGKFLSPAKLILFSILIFAGIFSTTTIPENTNSVADSIQLGIKDGYGTMDLLAAFFFCAVVCTSIKAKAVSIGITCRNEIIKIFFYSCLVGAALLGIVYIGFMLLAFLHADQLQGVDKVQMIAVISNVVLGKFGSLFVGVCVSLACLVTAVALTEVTTVFFYQQLFMKRIPRTVCLTISVLMTYAMSILGFAVIMKIALPILEILYPALIVYCVGIILFNLVKFKNEAESELEKASV